MFQEPDWQACRWRCNLYNSSAGPLSQVGPASFVPVSIVTFAMPLKVIDSNVTPSLLPEMTFWSVPEAPIVRISALPGVLKVKLLELGGPAPLGSVPFTELPLIVTGSNPVKAI